jgi:hypothetical protein
MSDAVRRWLAAWCADAEAYTTELRATAARYAAGDDHATMLFGGTRRLARRSGEVGRLERGVEAFMPLRRVAGVAADSVRALRRSLNEVEEQAAAQGFSITDDGRVVDRHVGPQPLP